MEDIDIFGTHTKEIPGINTLKALNKRKNYILKKLENKFDKNPYFRYLINEIRALEKAINFIKWIINNSTDDMVKKAVEKYQLENNKNNDEKNDTEKDEEGKVYSIFEERFSKNHFMEIVLSRYDGIDYILMESKRRKANKLMWEREGKVKMTLQRLEKVLRKVNKIECNVKMQR
jgi:thymidylate synthase